MCKTSDCTEQLLFSTVVCCLVNKISGHIVYTRLLYNKAVCCLVCIKVTILFGVLFGTVVCVFIVELKTILYRLVRSMQ